MKPGQFKIHNHIQLQAEKFGISDILVFKLLKFIFGNIFAFAQ